MIKKELSSIFSLLLLFLLVIPFCGASKIELQILDQGLDITYPELFVYPQGENITTLIWVSNSSDGKTITNLTGYCIFSITNNLGELIYRNPNMSYDGTDFGVEEIPCVYCFHDKILSGNFTEGGFYTARYNCRSYDDSSAGVVAKQFEITLTGENTSTEFVIARLGLILIFIIFLFYYDNLNQKINYEKWENQIRNKYQNRNYIKLVLSSIGYNVIKNKFVVYYLLGLPIIFLITEITNFCSITIFVDIMKIIVSFYIWSSILVAIYFFGYVQEWFMDLLEQIKNMNWGIQ